MPSRGRRSSLRLLHVRTGKPQKCGVSTTLQRRRAACLLSRSEDRSLGRGRRPRRHRPAKGPGKRHWRRMRRHVSLASLPQSSSLRGSRYLPHIPSRADRTAHSIPCIPESVPHSRGRPHSVGKGQWQGHKYLHIYVLPIRDMHLQTSKGKTQVPCYLSAAAALVRTIASLHEVRDELGTCHLFRPSYLDLFVWKYPPHAVTAI